MKAAVTRFVLAVALFTGMAAVPAAQHVVRRVEQPTPLDATDPLAVRSAALVKLILSGKKAPAVTLLRKEADETYAKGGTLEADIDAQLKRLSSGKYRIHGFDAGFGADVVVLLTNDKGDEANIVIRYNADTKMAGFAEAKISRD